MNNDEFSKIYKEERDKLSYLPCADDDISAYVNSFKILYKQIEDKKVEFIARARFLAWTCYQMGAGQEYNVEPTKDQLDSLMNGVRYGLSTPNATPESNHENWMKCKIEQGWIYGEVKDMEKKTHFDLVPFDDLIKVEKDKDIMDCNMNREFSKLWNEFFDNDNMK